MQVTEQKTSNIDERGTDQEAARQEIRQFCDRHFGGDISGAAVALGRTEEEVNEMISGNTLIDDDLMMKLRGIDQERSGESSARSGTDESELSAAE